MHTVAPQDRSQKSIFVLALYRKDLAHSSPRTLVHPPSQISLLHEPPFSGEYRPHECMFSDILNKVSAVLGFVLLNTFVKKDFRQTCELEMLDSGKKLK